MSNNVRIIYLYIVAFITLAMIVAGIISAVNNIAYYFFPDSYLFYEYDYNEYNEYSSYNEPFDYQDEERNEIERENYKTEKIKNTVVSLVVVVIGAIMYKYHWNMIEKEKSSDSEK